MLKCGRLASSLLTDLENRGFTASHSSTWPFVGHELRIYYVLFTLILIQPLQQIHATSHQKLVLIWPGLQFGLLNRTKPSAEVWPGRRTGTLRLHASRLKTITSLCLSLEFSCSLGYVEKRLVCPRVQSSAGNGAVDAGASIRSQVNRASGGAPISLCTAAAQN